MIMSVDGNRKYKLLRATGAWRKYLCCIAIDPVNSNFRPNNPLGIFYSIQTVMDRKISNTGLYNNINPKSITFLLRPVKAS